MTLMTLTGTSAFALVSGQQRDHSSGSFSGNDPAYRDAAAFMIVPPELRRAMVTRCTGASSG
jgi:hypothetical protein